MNRDILSSADNESLRFKPLNLGYARICEIRARTGRCVPWPSIFLKFSQAPLCLDKKDTRRAVGILEKQGLLRVCREGVFIV